jgi:hypothetical protein
MGVKPVPLILDYPKVLITNLRPVEVVERILLF